MYMYIYIDIYVYMYIYMYLLVTFTNAYTKCYLQHIDISFSLANKGFPIFCISCFLSPQDGNAGGFTGQCAPA